MSDTTKRNVDLLQARAMENSDDELGSDESQGNNEVAKDIKRTGIALAADEVVNRFGSANAEFIKGYRGIDNETGKSFAKGLADISKHKVNSNPVEAVKNIKQQAGFSAEVATTSRDNAEAIIQRSGVRTSRSDDLAQFGRNHNVVDRVQLQNGQIIEGSQAQMKFVGDREALFKKIAEEHSEGSKTNLSRYRGVKLELPSEQFEGAEQYCRDKAAKLRQQAETVEHKGKHDVAEKFRREADNYDQLADNVTDSGITTEEAIYYRKHPKIATVKDIARTSHRAGLDGAGCAALIGGCISLIQNGFSAAQGKTEMSNVAKNVALDSIKAGALGYGTAFAGSATKALMQQSGKQAMRTLANTSAPTLVVNVCLSLGSSVRRYVTGEITESQLLTEVGEKGAGMLSAGMMAALGQVALPIPFVGAAVGGMIGYTLSSLFYQSALDAARGVEVSRKVLMRTRLVQEVARTRIADEQLRLDAFISREIPQLQHATQQLFVGLSTVNKSADELSASINKFATLLGKQLEFKTMDEFDDFMATGRPLTL